MNKDIIRIANLLGWTSKQVLIGDGARTRWTHPDKGFRYTTPDPKTSHDDCHALIEWLNGRGWLVELVLNGEFAVVRFVWTKDSTIQHVAEFVPYREGVVELTLKILDEENTDEQITDTA